MKTFSRVLAMLLACAMLLGLGMTTACADNCYEMLKYTFSVEDNGDFAWLGQGMLVEGEEPENPENDAVFFYISFNGGKASVIGRNADGKPETCMWLEADEGELLLASIQVASSYQDLSTYLDQCNGLVMVLDTGDEADTVYITNAEEAEAYVTLLLEALEAMTVPAE